MQAHHDLTSQPSDARKKAQGKSKENNKMKAAGCLFAKTRSVQGNVKFSPGFPKKIIPFPPFLCPMLRCQIATGHSDLGGGAKRFFMGPFSHLGTRSTGGGGAVVAELQTDVASLSEECHPRMAWETQTEIWQRGGRWNRIVPGQPSMLVFVSDLDRSLPHRASLCVCPPRQDSFQVVVRSSSACVLPAVFHNPPSSKKSPPDGLENLSNVLGFQLYFCPSPLSAFPGPALPICWIASFHALYVFV